MNAGDRFVIAGLARPRAAWFRLVGQWASTAAIPAEFVKCVSTEELVARLRSGRPFSAVLLDAALVQLDRDLLDEVRTSGAVVIVVGDGRANDWSAIAPTVVLSPEFRLDELVDALATHAKLVPGGGISGLGVEMAARPSRAPAPLVAVCASSGAGSSTVAMALTQGFAAMARERHVVLADLCRAADLGMLHDVGDVIPGIQELVELFRHRQPDGDDCRRLTYFLPERGYHLLLGLRRSRYWSSVRPRAFTAALAAMCVAFDFVVADIDADFEGELHSGSIDLEDRNHMSRYTARAADVVVAVGQPGLKGIHSHIRLLSDLVELGVRESKILPVCNHAPRAARTRSLLVRTIVELAADQGIDAHALMPPIFMPEKPLEDHLRGARPMPRGLVDPITRAVASMGVIPRDPEQLRVPDLVAAGSVADRSSASMGERVQPGSLGHFFDADDEVDDLTADERPRRIWPGESFGERDDDGMGDPR